MNNQLCDTQGCIFHAWNEPNCCKLRGKKKKPQIAALKDEQKKTPCRIIEKTLGEMILPITFTSND